MAVTLDGNGVVALPLSSIWSPGEKARAKESSIR